MKNRHVVIAGSLHTGNIGDHALVKAFINQQEKNYQKLSILGVANEDLLPLSHNIITPPKMAIGYNFWKGYRQRLNTRKIIQKLMPDARRHYIWVGGLLGANVYHTKFRYKELNWASSFCDKKIYYFGDVDSGFKETIEGRKIIEHFNHSDSWIAVRSKEAADVFIEAGLRSKVYVGIDSVLYERCKLRNIPFIRKQQNLEYLAIVVCNVHKERCIPIWRASALAAISLGMKIRWVSLCDSEDIYLCKQLFQEFSEYAPKHPMEIVEGIHGEAKIAEASVCVVTRYHGAIFSLTSGVPTIAVPYGEKVKRLFKLLNLEDWLADPMLKIQNDLYWNSIMHELIKAALERKWQPNYTPLKACVKAHEEALSELEYFITS